MELEKRTMGSVDTSRTALAALAFAREVGKESSPGCAIWFGNSGTVNRMEPEGFKRVDDNKEQAQANEAGLIRVLDQSDAYSAEVTRLRTEMASLEESYRNSASFRAEEDKAKQ